MAARLEVQQADVTKLDVVDAIANAANTRLLHGGGVAGVGGFPLDEAARIMVGVARSHPGASLERIVFAVHGDEAERAFAAAVGAA